MTTVQVPAGTLSAATAATPAAHAAGINAVGAGGAGAAPRPAKAWVDPQVTRHTLYVGQAVSTAVECDGLALRITPNGQSTQRVPLPRLARVLSGPAARLRLVSQLDARFYAVVVDQLQQEGLALRYPTRRGRWLELALDLAVTLQALHALQTPMDGRAHTAARLRAQAFETSVAVQVDLVGWCLLILRRSALEHTQPWL